MMQKQTDNKAFIIMENPRELLSLCSGISSLGQVYQQRYFLPTHNIVSRGDSSYLFAIVPKSALKTPSSLSKAQKNTFFNCHPTHCNTFWSMYYVAYQDKLRPWSLALQFTFANLLRKMLQNCEEREGLLPFFFFCCFRCPGGKDIKEMHLLKYSLKRILTSRQFR